MRVCGPLPLTKKLIEKNRTPDYRTTVSKLRPYRLASLFIKHSQDPSHAICPHDLGGSDTDTISRRLALAGRNPYDYLINSTDFYSDNNKIKQNIDTESVMKRPYMAK